ncbi:hypothetical protein [uncultured Sphingomonas sp.]|uniref:hypothetical protein n=1 Tax=uncultured Sphingomonas sp. TaxID=158754 RepID=UPI0035C9F00F
MLVPILPGHLRSARWRSGVLRRVAAMLMVVACCGCTQRTPPPATASAPASPAVLGLGSARMTAVACARSAGFDVMAFTSCTRDRLVLSPQQQAMLDCAMSSQASEHFAECAAPNFGITLDKPQIVTADCAIRSGGTKSTFIACAGTAAGGKRITPREQLVLNCAAKAQNDATRFTACSAQQILGPGVTREQRIALTCAAQTGGNYAAFTTCAGANFFNIKLNPDQTIAVECIIQVGGLPTAAVGCMAVRFVTRELHTCAAKGFGGAHGCFGDDNALIGRNGWTIREINQLGDTRATMAASVRRWQSSAAWARTRSRWAGTGTFVRDPAAFWRERRAASVPAQ